MKSTIKSRFQQKKQSNNKINFFLMLINDN